MTNDERDAAWAAWLDDPERTPVRALAERFPPWGLFKMTDTGQIASVIGYFEDGTLRVSIDPEHNGIFELRGFPGGLDVFGINPDTLESWTPPLDG
jgi:hypothetical protein